jgi:hypothetical protein
LLSYITKSYTLQSTYIFSYHFITHCWSSTSTRKKNHDISYCSKAVSTSIIFYQLSIRDREQMVLPTSNFYQVQDEDLVTKSIRGHYMNRNYCYNEMSVPRITWLLFLTKKRPLLKKFMSADREFILSPLPPQTQLNQILKNYTRRVSSASATRALGSICFTEEREEKQNKLWN